MQDRLRELRKEEDDELEEEEDEAEGVLGSFFENVEDVKKDLENAENFLAEMEEKCSLVLAVIIPAEIEKTLQEIDNISSSLSSTGLKVKKKLERMKKELGEGTEKDKQTRRMRENMLGVLTRKFMQVMKNYQELQVVHENRWKDKIGRQLRLAAPDVTDQEIEAAIEGGEAQKVLQQKLFSQKDHEDAAIALDYLKERHTHIQKLEQSIQELHTLFVDFQLLVEAQEELLDQVEYTISQAVDYVDEAGKAIEIARKRARRGCCGCGCCIVC
eukprot:TRINITY_DN4066_c0_g5_i1.p1 TRINITY_DN4066_c0_g5~~TRINITY_DN4066_c0_g5_i1.p1  ORF type:complete len:272 (-),score=76.65 TRINITY_DN4066_c0_g5_i1:260-1075(-)